MILLVGAGLLLRSLGALTRVNPGFEASNLLTMEYRLPANKYPQGPQQWEFHRQVVERVRALPGVRKATVLRALPFSGNGSTLFYDVPDKPAPPDNLPRARFNAAEEQTFSTMGIPLLRGRGFDVRDTADSPPVAVVSQRMVSLAWPGQDPIGKRIRVMATPPLTAEVVGVVGDIKHAALDEPDLPFVYAPQAQQPHIFNTLVVRTEGDPMAMAPAVRAAVWSVDRDQPVWKIRTQESLVQGSTGFQRFVSRLLLVYSGLALLLAAVGIYGLMAYAVDPAHARDRAAHGAGGARARRPGPDAAGRDEADRTRGGRRSACGVRAEPAHPRLVVRDQPGRSGDVRVGRRAAADRRPGRLVPARPQGDARRSAGGAAARLAAEDRVSPRIGERPPARRSCCSGSRSRPA